MKNIITIILSLMLMLFLGFVIIPGNNAGITVLSTCVVTFLIFILHKFLLKPDRIDNKNFINKIKEIIIFNFDLNEKKISVLGGDYEVLNNYDLTVETKYNIADIFTGESLKEIYKIIENGIKKINEGNGKLYETTTFEMPINNVANKKIWVEFTITFLSDANNEISEIIGVARNINKRKQKEEKKIKELENLKFITDNLLDVIWCFDFKTMMCTYINNASFYVFGKFPEDIINKSSLFDFFPEEEMPKIWNLIEAKTSEFLKGESITIKATFKTMLHHFITFEKIPVEITAFVTLDENNQFDKLLGVTHDSRYREAKL